jgi:UDP:flavonoid glycosyltransferase YjiC (YdhE family)
MPHLVVSISGHGFGHVAQTAPVLNILHGHMPQLHLTVRSVVPLAQLHARIHAPFTHLTSEGDIGMVMSSSVDVLVEKSRAAYRAFHADWNARVADEARLLRELNADFVFSNVGYLPLAGAQRAGIPNAALCSLNWADIYRHYCGDDAIAAQIHGCYANADAFLRATPGMPMTSPSTKLRTGLPNIVPVAPIAAIGTNRRAELKRRLKLSADEKLVLVSLGGITSRLPIERWPRLEGVRWLVQDSWQVRHPDAIILETLQMGFGDLLASSDALICKPGYGSFVEAASCGVPVIYVSRAGWPEAPALISWLQQYGLCREVSRDALEQGDVAEALREIWNAPRPKAVIPEGGEQVANWLAERLK